MQNNLDNVMKWLIQNNIWKCVVKVYATEIMCATFSRRTQEAVCKLVSARVGEPTTSVPTIVLLVSEF